MDSFELIDTGADTGLSAAHAIEAAACHQPLTASGDHLLESLAVAHIANGMDPAAAALQARLDAPLLRPLLF